MGLDSFILLDDSPRECREVEAAYPQVLSLALPANDAEIPEFLRHMWAFDRLRVTEEDRARPAMYLQEQERQRAENQAASLEDFLRNLQLEVRIAPMSPKDLARVAQLTQRTNQMNFTTVRRSESDVQALLESGKAECLTVHVSDRFGSYGLAGAVIFRGGVDAISIDTFLLSCRALGRGVEHRMLAALGRIAQQRGLAAVEARYVRSQRNRPALLFLESVGLEFQSVRGEALLFRFPAEFAARITYHPSAAPRKAAGPAPQSSPVSRDRVPYARIASDLRSVEQIQERSMTGGARRLTPGPPEPPRSGLERQLCGIWSEMLNVQPVGIYDNFFDLGGHSLLAVQLLSRLKEDLAIELSLEVVYGADFTVAELAKAIELRRNRDGRRRSVCRHARRSREPHGRRSARVAGQGERGSGLLNDADPADGQRILRAAPRRGHAQQPAVAGVYGGAGSRLPDSVRRAGGERRQARADGAGRLAPARPGGARRGAI